MSAESTTSPSLGLACTCELFGGEGTCPNDTGGKAIVKSLRSATEPSREATAVNVGTYSMLFRRHMPWVPRPSATPVPGAIVLIVGCMMLSVNTCSMHSSAQCNLLLAPFFARARLQEVFR